MSVFVPHMKLSIMWSKTDLIARPISGQLIIILVLVYVLRLCS